jgi:2-keto-4-pentenoate hydratase/2-oxohepta-3-ene-1,7-dioic acid hydratase (catechol pathway)
MILALEILGPSKRYVVNWLRSKNLDTAAPIGPWIVTKDEIDDPYNLEVKVLVNDELRQKGNTNDMIFSISELIEYISKGLTLKPGDIISTGTPAGTGLSTGKFLRAGDVVRVIIEKIGTLENPVISE